MFATMLSTESKKTIFQFFSILSSIFFQFVFNFNFCSIFFHFCFHFFLNFCSSIIVIFFHFFKQFCIFFHFLRKKSVIFCHFFHYIALEAEHKSWQIPGKKWKIPGNVLGFFQTMSVATLPGNCWRCQSFAAWRKAPEIVDVANYFSAYIIKQSVLPFDPWQWLQW